MKPIVITSGKRAEYKPDKNKTTVLFYFPKPTKAKGEEGKIDLINGDVPRVVIKASAGVKIDKEGG